MPSAPAHRLFRRQGGAWHPVVPRFDARAISEIAFVPVRGGEAVDPEGWRLVAEHCIEAEADGPVQGEAEAELLRRLEGRLVDLLEGLTEGACLVIESAAGTDWPKTRERRRDVIIDGENRYHFHWRVEPPLRLGVWEPA